MKIEINVLDIPDYPEAKLIELKGELDVLGSNVLSRQLLSVIEGGWPKLFLDMHGLAYINSAGIHALLQCFNKAKEKGGFFRIFSANERITEILDVIGVTKILKLYANKEEAIKDAS